MDYPPESWVDNRFSSELPVLRARGESQDLEFMRKFPSNAQDLAKEIAAFATSNNGVILVGVDDDGGIVGIDNIETARDRDILVRRVEGMCRGPVKPAITPSVAFALEDSKIVLVIRVPKGPQPFYSSSNIPYVRHGRESRPAEPHEVVELVRRGLGIVPSPAEPDEASNHVTEVASVLRDLLVYGDEAEQRDLNPLLDNLMSVFSSAADQLRYLATWDEAATFGWQNELLELAEKADRVGQYRHYLGSESWRAYLKLVRDCVVSATALRRKYVDGFPYSAKTAVWAARRLREIQRTLSSLAERADSLIAAGRFDELQTEASDVGLSLAQLAYMGLDRQTPELIDKLKAVARELHLADSPLQSRGNGIQQLAQRLKDASKTVQEVAEALK